MKLLGKASMKLSVIIPVYNGVETLSRSLDGISDSEFKPDEIIIVDDSSTDGSGHLAEERGFRLISLDDGPHGPAYARNRGAEAARGEIIFFSDSDAVVHPDTLSKAVETLDADPSLAACFGSYDASPGAGELVSQFKNLMHHYVHQNSNTEAHTFWTACGAVRRDLFLEFGGFNENFIYLEDVEFGHRLTSAGKKIKLLKEMQTTHLKRWKLWHLIKCDIFNRAVPWTFILLRYKDWNRKDLNLGWNYRFSSFCVVSAVLSALAGILRPELFLLVPVFLLVSLVPHIPFLRFLRKKLGIKKFPQATVMLWLYFLYSLIGVVTGFLLYPFHRYFENSRKNEKSDIT